MAEHARAYVLIEAEAGSAAQILLALRATSGVVRAEPITGPYDIIVTVETAGQQDVGRLVMQHVHQLAGIKRTVTCLTIGDEG